MYKSRKVVCTLLLGLIFFLLLILTAFALALLAAAFFHLFVSFPRTRSVTCMPVSGEGNVMEIAVRFFCRYGSGEQYLIFVDRGLNADALACARLLEEGDPNVFVCKEEELYTLIKRLDQTT